MTLHHAAQLAAHTDPATARSLHVISLIRGRLDALEAAIAGGDARARLRTLVEVSDLFDELCALTAQREAA
jgi:hypothetical protein